MIKIKNIDSLKLYYVYFFPLVFFPFLNIYKFRNDTDIKSWLFNNMLISIAVILVPLLLALSMLITKFLYRDQDRKFQYNSVGLGFLCLVFLMGSNLYQFQKFSLGTELNIDYYRMALMMSFLLGCFASGLCFTLKYQQYSKKYDIDFNIRSQRFLISALPTLFLVITAFFVI